MCTVGVDVLRYALAVWCVPGCATDVQLPCCNPERVRDFAVLTLCVPCVSVAGEGWTVVACCCGCVGVGACWLVCPSMCDRCSTTLLHPHVCQGPIVLTLCGPVGDCCLGKVGTVGACCCGVLWWAPVGWCVPGCVAGVQPPYCIPHCARDLMC